MDFCMQPLMAVLLLPLAGWAQGETVYKALCANCHGISGEGARGPALAVAKLPRAPDDRVLEMVIRYGIPNSEMPPTRISDKDLAALIHHLRKLRSRPQSAAAGDAARGKSIYEKQRCSQCHVISGDGGRMGPELTAIGLIRGAAFLRRAITEPQTEVPDNFAQYRLIIPFPDNYVRVRALLSDGTTLEGIRLNEDPFTIQIRTLDDRLASLGKASLSKLEKDSKSLMPAYSLSPGELDDLVAFLQSLGGAR
jgi:putative heme-binding domain-containing protein